MESVYFRDSYCWLYKIVVKFLKNLSQREVWAQPYIKSKWRLTLPVAPKALEKPLIRPIKRRCSVLMVRVGAMQLFFAFAANHHLIKAGWLEEGILLQPFPYFAYLHSVP